MSITKCSTRIDEASQLNQKLNRHSPYWCVLISDTNECAAIPRICSHFCENLFGSFRCWCPEGYNLSSDNKTCDGMLFLLRHFVHNLSLLLVTCLCLFLLVDPYFTRLVPNLTPLRCLKGSLSSHALDGYENPYK